MDITGKSRKELQAVESLKDPATMKYNELWKLFHKRESLPRDYFLRVIEAGRKFDEYYRDFKITPIMDVDMSVVKKKREEEAAIAFKCKDPDSMTYDEISKAFDHPRALPTGRPELLRLFRAAKKNSDRFYEDFDFKRPADDDEDDDEGYSSTEDQLEELCHYLFPKWDDFLDLDTEEIMCGTYNWDNLVARGKELREAEERAAKGNNISSSSTSKEDAN